MFILSIITILVFSVLTSAVVILQKLNPELMAPYWYKAFVFSLFTSLVLSILALSNLFAFCSVSLIILMFTKEATKHLFSSPSGSSIIGLYFGFWLSLPAGIYAYIT